MGKPVDPKAETTRMMQHEATLGPCAKSRFSFTEQNGDVDRSVFVLLDVRPSPTGNGQMVNVSLVGALSEKEREQLSALLVKLHVAAAHAAGFSGG